MSVRRPVDDNAYLGVFLPVDASTGQPYAGAGVGGLQAGFFVRPDATDGAPGVLGRSVGRFEPRNWRLSDLGSLTTQGGEDLRLEVQVVADAELEHVPKGSAPWGQPEEHAPRNRSTRVVDMAGRVGLLSQLAEVTDGHTDQSTLAVRVDGFELGVASSLLPQTRVRPVLELSSTKTGGGRRTPVRTDTGGNTLVDFERRLDGGASVFDFFSGGGARFTFGDPFGSSGLGDSGAIRARIQAEVERLVERESELGSTEDYIREFRREQLAQRYLAAGLKENGDARPVRVFQTDSDVAKAGREEIERRILDERRRLTDQGVQPAVADRRLKELRERLNNDLRRALARRGSAGATAFGIGAGRGGSRRLSAGVSILPPGVDPNQVARIFAGPTGSVVQLLDGTVIGANGEETDLGPPPEAGPVYYDPFSGNVTLGALYPAGELVGQTGDRRQVSKLVRDYLNKRDRPFTGGSGSPGDGSEGSDAAGQTFGRLLRPTQRHLAVGYVRGQGLIPEEDKPEAEGDDLGGRTRTRAEQNAAAGLSTRTRGREGEPQPRGPAKTGLWSSVFLPEAARDRFYFGGEESQIGPLPVRCDAMFAMGPVHEEEGAKLLGRIRFVDRDAKAIPWQIVAQNTTTGMFKGELWCDTGLGDVDAHQPGQNVQWVPVIYVTASLPPSTEPPRVDPPRRGGGVPDGPFGAAGGPGGPGGGGPGGPGGGGPGGSGGGAPGGVGGGCGGSSDPSLAEIGSAIRGAVHAGGEDGFSAGTALAAGDQHLVTLKSVPSSLDPAAATPGPCAEASVAVDAEPDLTVVQTGVRDARPGVVTSGSSIGWEPVFEVPGGFRVGDVTYGSPVGVGGASQQNLRPNVSVARWPIFGSSPPGQGLNLEQTIQLEQISAHAQRQIVGAAFGGEGHLEAPLRVIARNRNKPLTGHVVGQHWLARSGEVVTLPDEARLRVPMILDADTGGALTATGSGLVRFEREHRGSGHVRDTAPLVEFENAGPGVVSAGPFLRDASHAWAVEADGTVKSAGLNVGEFHEGDGHQVGNPVLVALDETSGPRVGINTSDPAGPLDVDVRGNDGERDGGIVVTPEGDVGIGTEAPDETLEVVGTVGVTNADGFTGTFNPEDLEADRAYTLPDASGTLALEGAGSAGFPPRFVEGLQVRYASTTTATVEPGRCRDADNDTDVTLAASTTVSTGTGHSASDGLAQLNGLDEKGLDNLTSGAITCTVTGESSLVTASASVLGHTGKVAGTGTVTSSGFNVTGTGSLFLSEFAIGDYIGNATRGYFQINSISSNTALSVNPSLTPGFSGGESFERFERLTVKAGTGTNRNVIRISADGLTIEMDDVVPAQSAGSALTLGVIGGSAVGFWSYVWVVSNAAGNAGLLVSLHRRTLLAPPSGYTNHRRVGAIRINGSAQFVETFYVGEGLTRFAAIEPASATALSSGTATAWTGVDLSPLAPPTSTLAQIRLVSTDNTRAALARPRALGSATVSRELGAQPAGDTLVRAIATDGAQYVDYALNGASTGGGAFIGVGGYWDTL